MKKFLFLLLILNLTMVFSQQEVGQKDVKVGLVLSGGGAKGFAHVGVLKVLEEAGIRIDYIAGTSMGAIVGGLYAAGYNANQLDSILKVNDFSVLLQDRLPRDASSFYQKENTGKYAISLPIKKMKIGFPSAISKGQNVFNLLSRLTTHVHEIKDFSKLPIPFFCIATDLETGSEVVLEKGFLPEAIRASGSFPGLLAPVIIDDRVLVDGGLVNNYPVKKLKEKGLDYIIGVDVQMGLLKRDELNNVPVILMQIASFQILDEFEDKIKMTDVYIKPNILKYNDFSFDKEPEIVKAGEKAARKHLTELKKIAKNQISKKHDESIENFDLKQDLFIKEIEINGNRNYTDNYCMDKLKIIEGKSISQKEFIEGINALSATRNFKSIQYKFVHIEGGIKVEFKLIENDVSAFLQLGAHYDDLYKTGILINFTKKHLLTKNDFLSADFIVGDNIRYNIDYFLDNGFNWSLGLNTRYNKFKDNLTIAELPIGNVNDNNFKVPVEYNDFTTQLYVQTTLSNKLGIRLGVEHKYLNVFTEQIEDDKLEKVYFDKSNYFNLFGKATYDSYDTKYFPKSGFYFNANYIVYLFSPNNLIENFESFSQLFGRLGIAHTFFDKLTLHFISEAGLTIGSNRNQVHDFHLGGTNENYINTFVPFYGYDAAELNESSFLKSALTIRYEIFKKHNISFTGNFARLNDDLWNNGRIFEDIRSGYAFGYGFNSMIGPIELIYMWNPDNSNNFWRINLGFWF